MSDQQILVALARCYARLKRFDDAKRKLRDAKYASLRPFADDPDFAEMRRTRRTGKPSSSRSVGATRDRRPGLPTERSEGWGGALPPCLRPGVLTHSTWRPSRDPLRPRRSQQQPVAIEWRPLSTRLDASASGALASAATSTQSVIACNDGSWR